MAGYRVPNYLILSLCLSVVQLAYQRVGPYMAGSRKNSRKVTENKEKVSERQKKKHLDRNQKMPICPCLVALSNRGGGFTMWNIMS